MCNDYGNDVPYNDYLQAFSQTRIPGAFSRGGPQP